MKKSSRNELARQALQMLQAGKDRQEVKRFLTSHRVKARQAVALLCKQEMVFIRAEHFRQKQS
ncbi:hypothetical protein HL273_08795 [Yersinia enterocolitica]|uniref:hypothetical protein n=1 Tax=Yersinia TaxID=629 RepID=UPI00155A2291|nr:hypothetical protein [Yersinia enterocolitica]MBX9485824.1 hypothetical protein [Yersinia enterocolitica]NQS96715.1 hypothetical protein [Yersinia enterocolitica]NQT43392.1 hypothetical protein [Yersinia enterocolitica]NQT98808.1 hypothetical protein [Yersinia enterocolitica]HDM8448674.1 hypothetical protein [Yersinia enterocolitica]